MKTLTTFLLILTLIVPGAVLAGPNDRAPMSLWQSVLDWFADTLDGLPDYGGALDPGGVIAPEPESLLGIGETTGPARLAVPSEAEPDVPRQPENAGEEPPPLPNAGGFIDPVG